MTTMSHDEVAAELRAVLDGLDGHDPDFAVPILRAVLHHCRKYFHGTEKLTALIWHMKRFRNEVMTHDRKEAGG